MGKVNLMFDNQLSRRNYLAMLGAGASLAASAPAALALPGDEDRARRMKWWHEAKFGMFIHWGLYSVLGRHEWVMENEGIPVAEYEQLAKRFTPKPNAARDWARLAKQAGHEVHGDDHQASRGLLPVRHQAHRLLRAQAGLRPRPGQGVRGGRARRRVCASASTTR